MADYNYSPINLKDFEVVPDTPVSMQNVRFSMEEFTEASPLTRAYCKQVTVDDYEKQACDATAEAINELIEYLSKNPSQFKKTMRKRKMEELESSGITSFLKSRFLTKVYGEKYIQNLVSESECKERLDEVKSGMLKAYSYAREAKGKRYNTRLAARQASEQALTDALDCSFTSNTDPAPVPPPLPPVPPPVLSPFVDKSCKQMRKVPLADRTNVFASTPCLQRPSLKRTGSNASMASVQQELLSCNPLKRLRATNNARSPGGTPVKHRGHRSRPSLDSLRPNTPLNTSESLTSIFMRIMDEKFKNVRSPSPAPDTPQKGDISNDFTP